AVIVSPDILSVRVDESLYFANSRFLEDRIAALISGKTELRHVILVWSAVTAVDASALERLEALTRRPSEAGIRFHLSEVKGPVMDKLSRTEFLDHLTGKVFLSQHEAVRSLSAHHPHTPQETPGVPISGNVL